LTARGAAVSGSVGKKGTMRNAAYVNISRKFVYITILITFIRVLQGEYHVYNFKEFSIKKLQEMLHTPVFILLDVFNISFKRGKKTLNIAIKHNTTVCTCSTPVIQLEKFFVKSYHNKFEFVPISW
jgi:hypothetical protein